MKYLIDTQILIWFQLNDRQLKRNIRAILTDTNNQIFVSDITLYEIAIKQKINKLQELYANLNDIILVANEDKFKFLPISHTHLLVYGDVPLLSEHKDPFDRLIIAMAISENLPIISADEKFKLYTPLISLIEA